MMFPNVIIIIYLRETETVLFVSFIVKLYGLQATISFF